MNSGSEIAERLAWLLDKVGPPLLEDPLHASTQLAELLPGLNREVRLIRVALELGLHKALLDVRSGGPDLSSTLARIAKRLEQEAFIKPWAAGWAVHILAKALGLPVPAPGLLGPHAQDTPPPQADSDPALARRFEDMDSVPPSLAFRLEHDPAHLATRTIDLFCPVGRGQRGLIIGRQDTGKTNLLQEMARGLASRDEDLWLAGMQIGFRPDEGQALQQILGNGVFVLPDDPVSAVEVAQCLLDDARRLALQGYDAVLLVDSMTDLARAYAAVEGTAQGSGPRDFLSAGRNLRQGGSVTVIGTALDGGSEEDQACLQQLLEIADCQVWLDAGPSAQYVRPAILLPRSQTRGEDRLFSPPVLRASRYLRQQLQALPPHQAREEFHQRLHRFPTNRALLQALWDGDR